VGIVEVGTDFSQRSVAELREQAAGYRRMAETARVLNTEEALIKIADRFDALADQREQEQLRHKSRGGGASRSD
jgi:hypothetical protein